MLLLLLVQEVVDSWVCHWSEFQRIAEQSRERESGVEVGVLILRRSEVYKGFWVFVSLCLSVHKGYRGSGII